MPKRWNSPQRVVLTLLFVLVAGSVQADEIKLLSPEAMKPVLSELVPQFEKSDKHTVVIEYGSATAILKRIEAGEAADLAILSPQQLEQLQRQGKVVAATAIAKVGFGLVVRAGANRPDIGSVAALKRALADARSISSGDPAKGSSSGRALAALVERLNATAAVGPKIKLYPSGTAALEAVANGDVELGFEVISAANGPGLVLAAALPAELQSYNSYAGGILASGQRGYAARFLLAFLASDASHAILQAKDFERP